MTRRPGPPDHPDRRTTPIPPRRDVRRPPPPPPPWRPPAPPPQRPAQWQPPRRPPPVQPQRPPAQPWYLEVRRPPAANPQPPVRPLPPRIAPPPPPPPAPPNQVDPQPRSNRWLLIGAGIAGLLALTVLSGLVLRGVVGGSAPVDLDVTHAQAGVRQVLTDPVNGYGRDDVTDVRCNNGVNPRVRKGTTFTCTVTVDGAQRQVLVEFSDNAGTYLVDRPR